MMREEVWRSQGCWRGLSGGVVVCSIGLLLSFVSDINKSPRFQ